MHRDKIKLLSYSHLCFCLLTRFCLNFKSTDVQTKLSDGFCRRSLRQQRVGCLIDFFVIQRFSADIGLHFRVSCLISVRNIPCS